MKALSIVAALGLAFGGQEEGGTSLPGIVATVGSDPITKSELDRKILREAALRGQRISPDPRYQRFVLRQMIDELLILQEAERRAKSPPDRKGGKPESSGLVTDETIDQKIEARIEELKKQGWPITSTQHFYDLQRQMTGLTREEIREEIRRELTIQRFFWGGPFRRIDTWVTPGESRYYYKMNPDEFTNPVEISYRQIFLEPDRFNAPLAKEKIEKGLEAGVPFQELAQRYSQDFEDPQDRGAVITKTFEEIQHWEPPLPKILRDLEKDKVAGPVETRRAIHYFQVVDRLEGKPKPYEEAQEEIEKKILMSRRLLKQEQVLERLRQKTVIEVFLPGAEEDVRLGEREKEADTQTTAAAGG